jgi:CRP-like cAMP-binding protein
MTKNADSQEVRSSILGDELDKNEAAELAKIMGVRQIKDGELLIAEGGAANTLFLLVEGKLGVFSIIDGEEVAVYTMSKGECAGTRAFVDRTPRKATLRAIGNATVYTLDPAAFETLLDTQPRVVYKVMRALFRITHTNLMRMNQESQQLANYINKTHGRY